MMAAMSAWKAPSKVYILYQKYKNNFSTILPSPLKQHNLRGFDHERLCRHSPQHQHLPSVVYSAAPSTISSKFSHLFSTINFLREPHSLPGTRGASRQHCRTRWTTTTHGERRFWFISWRRSHKWPWVFRAFGLPDCAWRTIFGDEKVLEADAQPRALVGT
jgi:hypothetical protein